MPKLSGLINEREISICGRLRDTRNRLGWSQSELAGAIGTTRDLLASVEYGRNPLRYWLADRFCEKFNICQQWLATGAEPIAGYVGIPPEIGLEVSPREPFSAAYDRRIGHIVKRHVLEAESLKRSVAAQLGGADKLLQDRLYTLALVWFQRIPSHLYDEYFRELMSLSSDFYQRHSGQLAGIGQFPPSEAFEKKSLRQFTEMSKSRKVILNLATLRTRLVRLTKPIGMKGRLAHSLGVPQSRVSEWLSGRTAPGGETTLQLLNWVEHEEAKQKSPGRAETRPEPKAQLRKSKHAKPKSGPKKR